MFLFHSATTALLTFFFFGGHSEQNFSGVGVGHQQLLTLVTFKFTTVSCHCQPEIREKITPGESKHLDMSRTQNKQGSYVCL